MADKGARMADKEARMADKGARMADKGARTTADAVGTLPFTTEFQVKPGRTGLQLDG